MTNDKSLENDRLVAIGQALALATRAFDILDAGGELPESAAYVELAREGMRAKLAIASA